VVADADTWALLGGLKFWCQPFFSIAEGDWLLVLTCRQCGTDRRKKPQALSERFCVKTEMPEARISCGLELFDFPAMAKMLKNADILVRQP